MQPFFESNNTMVTYFSAILKITSLYHLNRQGMLNYVQGVNFYHVLHLQGVQCNILKYYYLSPTVIFELQLKPILLVHQLLTSIKYLEHKVKDKDTMNRTNVPVFHHPVWTRSPTALNNKKIWATFRAAQRDFLMLQSYSLPSFDFALS